MSAPHQMGDVRANDVALDMDKHPVYAANPTAEHDEKAAPPARLGCFFATVGTLLSIAILVLAVVIERNTEGLGGSSSTCTVSSPAPRPIKVGCLGLSVHQIECKAVEYVLQQRG